jgi:hypothetical protein
MVSFKRVFNLSCGRVAFGEALFQQVVGIPMGTNCAPLLADLFLCSYESEFLQNLVKDKKIHETRAFNFTYCCTYLANI